MASVWMVVVFEDSDPILFSTEAKAQAFVDAYSIPTGCVSEVVVDQVPLPEPGLRAFSVTFDIEGHAMSAWALHCPANLAPFALFSERVVVDVFARNVDEAVPVAKARYAEWSASEAGKAILESQLTTKRRRAEDDAWRNLVDEAQGAKAKT
jgi:hypothetical protein